MRAGPVLRYFVVISTLSLVFIILSYTDLVNSIVGLNTRRTKAQHVLDPHTFARVLEQLNNTNKLNIDNQPDPADMHIAQTTITRKASCKILDICSSSPKGLPFRPNVTHDLTGINLDDIFGSEFEPGGQYYPLEQCYTNNSLAVIIPFRDREAQLQIFLKNLIPFLKTQQVQFRIFVVEQEMPQIFNKGAMMNIGIIESQKEGHFDCFVFHDVDLIPENLCNIYKCAAQPRHLTEAISKLNYTNRYVTNVGGGTILHKDLIENIKGFGNSFYGWGGEDDLLFIKTLMANYTWLKYDANIARYSTLMHERDSKNPESRRGWTKVKEYWQYQKFDGLRTTKYNITMKKYYKILTHIKARITGPRNKHEMALFARKRQKELKAMLVNDEEELERLKFIALQQKDKLHQVENDIPWIKDEVRRLNRTHRYLRKNRNLEYLKPQ